jgi:hypothetical protein
MSLFGLGSFTHPAAGIAAGSEPEAWQVEQLNSSLTDSTIRAVARVVPDEFLAVSRTMGKALNAPVSS